VTRRLPVLLAGLWAGVILALGALAAPSAFAVASREAAGLIAGRFFMQEAYLSLLAAIALFLMLRLSARATSEAGQGSMFSVEMILSLAALFLTVIGYFALQPMMQAARAAQDLPRFGMLHGLSAALFCVKGLVVLVLAWRLAGTR